MTSFSARRIGLGTTAVTVLGLLAAGTPALAASPSYSVTCSSAQFEASRTQVTTHQLHCEDSNGAAVDEYLIVSQPTKAESFDLDADTGEVTYQPKANAVGTDTFTFKARVESLDESPVTTAVITIENDRPVCETVAPQSVRHNASLTVPLVCSDPDGDTLQLQTGTTGAAHGNVAIVAGKAVYTPAPGYTGADAFTLVATDGDLLSVPAAVAVTVTNAAPTCAPGAVRTTHGRAVSFPISCADADGDTPTPSVVAKAQHGTVTVAGTTATYRPAAGYVGSDVFTLGATDGLAASAPAAFAVQVTNAIPTCKGKVKLSARSAGRSKSTKVPFKLTCTDGDRDAVKVVVAAKPKKGKLVSKGGKWTYVAKKGFAGKDTFILKATDGVSTGKPVKFTVTVKKPARKR